MSASGLGCAPRSNIAIWAQLRRLLDPDVHWATVEEQLHGPKRDDRLPVRSLGVVCGVQRFFCVELGVLAFEVVQHRRPFPFVAETKGSLSSLQLRGIEEVKIECARKLFDELSRCQEDAVKYDVVTEYGELMQLVGAI